MREHFRLSHVTLLALALLTPAMALALPEDVILNEITTWSPQAVEVRNTGPVSIDLNGFQIVGDAGLLLTVVGEPPIPPDGLRVFNLPGDPLDITGDAVGWLDTFNNPIEFVTYGQKGAAPAPVSKPQFSLCRTGGGAWAPLALNWTIDPSHTLGFANDAPAPDLNGFELVMNEWDLPWLDAPSATPQVELLNNAATSLTLSGYTLSNDLHSVTIPTMVLPAGGFVVVDVTDLGMGGTHPNVYLLRGDGVRLDQIGFVDAPDDSTTLVALRLAGDTICAIPDGSGPHDGFDLPSSGWGVTRLPCDPTLGGSNQAVPVEPTSWGRIKARHRGPRR